MDFWSAFSNLLISKGYNSSSLASELDMPKTTIYKWKEGSSPSLDKLIPIADILNVSLDELAGRTSPVHTEQEARLLYLFRNLSEKEQESLLEFLDTNKLISKSSKK